YGKPWQWYVAQGDVALATAHDGDKPSYAAAAEQYERAINDLAEEDVCANSHELPLPMPSPAQYSAVHKKMEDAKLRPPTFRLVTTRDGECGGVFIQHVKGFEATPTQLPIEFDYNSTVLTAKGRQAAEALRQCVGNYARIRLSGHTDRVGS